MANNYYDMTGVLVLDKVTPVVEALFSPLELDADYPGNGEAYIAQIAESTASDWDCVNENLQGLAEKLGLTLEDDEGNPAETVEEVLEVLARHFNATQNEDLGNLIDQEDFNDQVTLDALFTIAQAFNDGHGLKAYKAEAAWHCSKPRLFEFGGSGVFVGSHVTTAGTSSEAISFGEALETALSANDVDAVAVMIHKKVGSLLAGIFAEEPRAEVRRKLAKLLSD